MVRRFWARRYRLLHANGKKIFRRGITRGKPYSKQIILTARVYSTQAAGWGQPVLFDGDLEDLSVCLLQCNGRFSIATIAATRWFKALPLENIDYVSSIARLSEDEWLIVGRHRERGALQIFRPLRWELEPLPDIAVSALVATASQSARNQALAVGVHGAAVVLTHTDVSSVEVSGAGHLSAAGLDAWGGCWAGSSDGLWYGEHQLERVYHNEESKDPFISILADVHLVRALTVWVTHQTSASTLHRPPATSRYPAWAPFLFREAKKTVVDEFERHYLSRLLERTSGNVRKAAREARMDRSYLIELLKRHQLRP